MVDKYDTSYIWMGNSFSVEEDGEIKDIYSARVKFRGFDEKSNTKGYINVSRYMKDNSNELFKESKEN